LGSVAALLALGGCGGDDSVEEKAVVTVYASAEQCQGAGRDLDRFKGRAGELRVELVCLPPQEAGGRLDLATVGENARRATEDSSAVAYLEAPGRASAFSEPILAEAELALIQTRSGATSMGRVLDLLAEWDSSEGPRETVWEGR
jgi:hypothetical protein